jgi:hypothetical protein
VDIAVRIRKGKIRGLRSKFQHLRFGCHNDSFSTDNSVVCDDAASVQRSPDD